GEPALSEVEGDLVFYPGQTESRSLGSVHGNKSSTQGRKISSPSEVPPFENRERWGTPRLKMSSRRESHTSGGDVGHPPADTAAVWKAWTKSIGPQLDKSPAQAGLFVWVASSNETFPALSTLF